MAEIPRLEIRLLGGFEARLGDRSLGGFESQKARALFVYLALTRAEAIDRDRLATLLWAERGDESARRNLRQALYSVRSVVASDLGTTPLFAERDKRTIQMNPELDIWLDTEAFEEEFEAGLRGKSPDVRHLSSAAALYRGDFLAGFFVRDCPEFEDWLIVKQEELREEAVEAFRTLVSVYLARGEYRFGIRHAKRLLAIDPLSEEAHRNLMRLYLMAGRRTRALAQYEHLLNLLQQELGVTPMEETTEIYRSVLLADRSKVDAEDAAEPAAPMIPLVGRSDAFEALQDNWQSAAAGNGGVTVITGEAGIGKSRLAKSFVDGTTSRRHAIVLRGHCYGESATVCYRPFSELITGTLNDILPDEDLDGAGLDGATLSVLERIAAKTGQPARGAVGGETAADVSPTRVAAAMLELFDLLCNPQAGPSRPLILLLEDFQWADSSSLRLLREIAGNLSERPVWILVTSRIDLTDEIAHLWEESSLPLTRLSSDDCDEIASSLVDFASAKTLSHLLLALSEGLPLKIAELINLLWDEGRLEPGLPGQWSLDLSTPLEIDGSITLSSLIQRRITALPTSARRLLAISAVYGHQFDVEILQQAADEHLGVVETCIELALERWLIRQFPRSWSPAGLERDIVLWARGARRGYFEFSHDEVRRAILGNINPIRKAVMHRELGQALEDYLGPLAHAQCEELAHHWLQAQEPERALPWLEASAIEAAACGAADIRDDYVGKALQIVGRLKRDSDGSSQGLDALHERLMDLQAKDLPAD